MTSTSWVLTLLLSFSQAVQVPLEGQEGSKKEFSSLALSFEANRETFRLGTFRFEFTKGSATSNEEALAGRFSRAYTAQGLYVFDGKNSRYELNYALEDVVKTTRKVSQNERRAFLSPLRMLCDGETTLVDVQYPNESASAFASSVMVHPGAERFSLHFIFPLYIGQVAQGESDLRGKVKQLNEGKCSLKQIDFHSRLGATDVCKAVLDFGTGQRTYWIDMNRGAIPLRIEDSRDSEVTHVTVYDDLRFIAGAGWLPMTERFAMQRGGIARHIRITDIDVRQKPAFSAFQLDFPRPISLEDAARNLRYSPRRTWSLLQLPKRGSPDAKPSVPKSYVPGPEMPGEIAAGSFWPQVFCALSVVAMIVVSLRLFIRRRPRSGRQSNGEATRS